MKKLCGATIALLAVLVLATCSMAAPEESYLKIGDECYTKSDDIAKVTAPDSEEYGSGDVIEVYGKVEIPATFGSTADSRLPNYTWVVSKDNVTIEGKTDDAAIYCATDVNATSQGGAQGLQSTMIILGSNVTMKNVTVMPNFDSYFAEGGNDNKTVEVQGGGFTMDGCTITKNTAAPTGNGGALFFNGPAAADILVTNSTFDNCYVVFCDTDPSVNIHVTKNTFNTPQEGVYCIGNNTWSTPAHTEMGTVYVENNTFSGLPEGYNQVVYQRMSGTFVVKNNVLTDVNGQSVSMLDSISFGLLSGSAEGQDLDCVSGSKGVIMVTEGGKTYKVTVADAANAPENLAVLEVSGASAGTPAAPNVAATDTVEPQSPAPLLASSVMTSDDVATVQKTAADLTGMPAGLFDVNADGQVVLTQAAVAQAAAAALGENETVRPFNVVPMPVFTAAAATTGNVAAVGFQVQGSALLARNAADVKVLKVLSATTSRFFAYAGSESAYADGAFTVLDANDEIAGAIDADATYTLVLFIKDNGAYDLDGDDNEITDPAAVVQTSATPRDEGGSSSSGCNAGFAALAMLLIAPLAALKKRS